jgi:hypothetical protein
MDELIDYANTVLVTKGYEAMPVDSYDFYKKSDKQILQKIGKINKGKNVTTTEDMKTDSPVTELPDVHHGTKMVLKQYFKWLDSDKKGVS